VCECVVLPDAECGENNNPLIALFVIASLIYSFGLYHLSQGDASADIKIALYNISTSRYLLGAVPWMSWLGILDYAPQGASSGVCFMPLSPYQVMSSSLYIPLLFLAEILGFGCLHACAVLVAKHVLRVPVPRAVEFHLSRYVTAVLALLLSSYTDITGVCLSYLNW
jgi:hypothetical protein